jgi:AraC family transcriptional regulator
MPKPCRTRQQHCKINSQWSPPAGLACSKAEHDRTSSAPVKPQAYTNIRKIGGNHEYPVKSLPALKLVGLRYQGKNENNEIADTWTAFNQRTQEIKNVINSAAYGVCFIPEGLPEGEFAYLCAFPVSEFRDIPAGMATLELEPIQAAVFEHRGAYETLGKTYANIYQKWLPEAGLNH